MGRIFFILGCLFWLPACGNQDQIDVAESLRLHLDFETKSIQSELFFKDQFEIINPQNIEVEEIGNSRIVHNEKQSRWDIKIEHLKQPEMGQELDISLKPAKLKSEIIQKMTNDSGELALLVGELENQIEFGAMLEHEAFFDLSPRFRAVQKFGDPANAYLIAIGPQESFRGGFIFIVDLGFNPWEEGSYEIWLDPQSLEIKPQLSLLSDLNKLRSWLSEI